MAFNPNDYIIDLRGKKYLQVAHRIMWYREVYPGGAISTDLITFEPQLVMRASITDNDGHTLATGYGSAQPKAGAVWAGREVEKAETAAIGRALALAGFGTQFANEYDDDDNHLADSPQPARTAKQRKTPPAPANGNGKAAPTPAASGDAVDVMLVSFERRTSKDGRPYLLFKTDTGESIAAYSSQLFREAGIAPDGFADWQMSEPIPARIAKGANGYWQITSVGGDPFADEDPLDRHFRVGA